MLTLDQPSFPARATERLLSLRLVQLTQNGDSVWKNAVSGGNLGVAEAQLT